MRRGGVGGRGEGWHQCVVGLLSPLALSANGSTGSEGHVFLVHVP